MSQICLSPLFHFCRSKYIILGIGNELKVISQLLRSKQKGISGSFPQCIFILLFTMQLHVCALGFSFIGAVVNSSSPFPELHPYFTQT